MRLRLVAALAIALAACTSTSASPGPSVTDAPSTTMTPTTTTSSTTTTSTTTTTIPTTTTTPPPTTTTITGTVAPSANPVDLVVTRGIAVPGGVPLDVFAPEAAGPWPAIVLFHGGGWISGEKEDLEPLARRIAGHGVVVFNAGYEVLTHGTFFPETFQQVTCAIRTAASLAEDQGSTGDGLAVVGYSAGAHLGALSAFSDGALDDGCEDLERAAVTGLVGIAGPYDSTAYPQLLLNFGATRDNDPELWAAGNPITYVEGHPPLPTLLLHGELDFVVAPLMSIWFDEALREAGHPTQLVTFPELDHFGVVDLQEGGGEIARHVADFVRQLAPDR